MRGCAKYSTASLLRKDQGARGQKAAAIAEVATAIRRHSCLRKDSFAAAEATSRQVATDP